MSVGYLNSAELRRFVGRMAQDPARYMELIRHDPAQRVYEQLHLDSQIGLWLICWMPGHDTGFHDHDVSAGAVAVLQGEVCEERLVLGGPPRRRRVKAGGTFSFSAADIHRVTHAGRVPAVTLHAYSPPLGRMGQYEIQPGGQLVRHPKGATDELRPLAA